MNEYKEFQGKTMDAAIAEACAYYDVPREKLEIDIVEDAKSGIFGIVGARKATIKARRAALPGTRQTENAQEGAETKGDAAPARGRGRGGRKAAAPKDAPEAPQAAETDDAGAYPESSDAPESPESPESAESADAAQEAAPKGRSRRGGRGSAKDEGRSSKDETRPSPRAPAPSEKSGRSGQSGQDRRNGNQEADHDSLPRVPLADLDQEALLRVTEEMVGGLVRYLVGDAPMETRVHEDRVQVQIDCEDTGLLIGRDGQNLAAVQYLAARMITRAMGSQVRLQVNAGDYHARQDSYLRELALELADKVRATGRSQSTKMLSAYQRRVIHLTLQDDPDVQTRSAGDGALKRVVVQRRKD